LATITRTWQNRWLAATAQHCLLVSEKARKSLRL
jgi:hypothetical protein